MSKEQQLSELKAYIELEIERLHEALSEGHRVIAHELVDSIIDTKREIEDMK